MHDNLTMPVLPKDTCSKYFKQIDISAGTWKCKCGKVLVQKKNTGWSNLLNHVKRQHPEESANAVNNTPSVINAFAVDETSRKGRNILLPIHLEEQLFLKINNKFWDEKLVSGIC